MTIYYKDCKEFRAEDLKSLFSAVEWYSAKYPGMLVRAMKGATFVFSAWDGRRLVGLARCLSDGAWQAKLDCLVVDPAYQHHGIGTHLLEMVKAACCETLYLEVVPDEPCNIPFYQARGFSPCPDAKTLKINRSVKEGETKFA